MPEPRVAIVHERFTELGGSERVVEQLRAIWPHATVHAPIVDPAAFPEGLVGATVHSSPLQRLYRGDGRYAHLLPLLPTAMARLRLPRVDVVITSHHAFANRVRSSGGAPLVSYTHTPARWMWDAATRRGEAGRVGRAALATFAATQRYPDRAAARRATAIVSNSRAVAGRVQRAWGRPSEVVHPPVDTTFYTRDPSVAREDFFLLAGRLVPYKQPVVAVEAATRAGVPLVVAGDGRALATARRVAGPTVRFLGRVDDPTLRSLYRRCRALLFPGEEDFGIVPVEAQACGSPVIAYGAGGALDSVVPGATGLHYPALSPEDGVEALETTLRRFDAGHFDPAAIRRHAEGFSRDTFRRRMRQVVDRLL